MLTLNLGSGPNGFHLGRNGTRYMHCNFSNRLEKNGVEVKIGERVIPQLRSILQNDRQLMKTSHRIHGEKHWELFFVTAKYLPR